MIRTYSELVNIESFIDRYEYLKLSDKVGKETFGFDRYLNQAFYKSKEWRRIRDEVIIRDNGCDLGISDREIFGKIYVHHMNPITKTDLIHDTEALLNPDYLICVSHRTHNAIHYGNKDILLANSIIERSPNDTCPWR